jgi:hypothetical protein
LQADRVRGDAPPRCHPECSAAPYSARTDTLARKEGSTIPARDHPAGPASRQHRLARTEPLVHLPPSGS